MAFLKNQQTGQRISLRSTHTIGRSRRCDLYIPLREVSGLHATLRWDGSQWELRDQSSRNGTWCQGRRLRGEPVSLTVGDVLVFGHAEEAWLLETTTPPAIVAIPLEGEPVYAVQGLLVLPHEENPLVSLFQSADGLWLRESATESELVTNGEVLIINGQQWKLELPDSIESTLEPTKDPGLKGMVFHFEVSADEAYVTLTAQYQHQRIDLGCRSHHHTLLALARRRIRDQGNESLGEEHKGWVHVETLCEMLQQTEAQINLDVFRIRRHLGKAGINGVARIIERQAYRKMLRFASSEVQIVNTGQNAPAGTEQLNQLLEAPIFPVTDQVFLAKLNTVLEANLSTPNFSTTQLAKRMAMGSRTLQREVLRLTEMSPTDLIRQTRLEAASEMLKTGRFSTIGEVAAEVGFSRGYFSRTYTAWAGHPPVEDLLTRS